MESAIVIIDHDQSKGSEEGNLLLIFTALLTSPRILSNSPPADFMVMCLTYDNNPENVKLSLFMKTQKANPMVNETNLASIEKYYRMMLEARRKKGKSKIEIVNLMKAENYFKNLFIEYKGWVLSTVQQRKYEFLLPFSCTEFEQWDKPFLALPNMFQEIFIDSVKNRVLFVTSSLRLNVYHHFFEFDIVKGFSHTSIVEASEKADFISEFLFEIPDPLSLTAFQISHIRNELSSAFGKLYEQIRLLNDELLKIPFEPNQYEKITALYQERIAPLIAAAQKSSEENEYFKTLKAENPNTRMCRVCLGITSFDMLCQFYRELGILNESDALYIKEELTLPREGNWIWCLIPMFRIAFYISKWLDSSYA